MNSYIDDNKSSLGHVVAYAEERFAYDLKYFVTDRVQRALDYLAEHTAKIKTIAVTFELDLSLLEGRFRETLVSLETLLEKTKHHIDVLQERLEAYRISINAFYAGYADLYHRMELTVDWALEAAIPGIPFPGFMDMSPIPVAEFFLPTAPLNWPELELDYQAIHDLLDETAQQCMEVMLEMLETLQAQANRHLRGAMQEIAEALVDILELKDYHPPKYQGSDDSIDSLEEELEYQSKIGTEMKTRMDTMLENLVAQALNIQVDEISIPELPKANYSYANDGRGFEYLDMSFPSITLPKFLEFLFVWLPANVWILDIAIQLFRVWKLEGVYAKGAIPDLPEIKFRDEDDESGSYRTKYLLVSAAFKSLFNGQRIVIAAIYIVVATVWFAHYKSAEFTCQQSQQKLCASIAGKAEATRQADWTAFHALQAQHNESLEALSLLEDCLESDTMSTLMNQSCCGLKGYNTTGCQFPEDLVCPIDSSTTPPKAFSPLESYLSNSACQPDLEWSLSDVQYNCGGLRE
ncbi:MAG: hypothetical protein SGILL_004994, partial [Bacillariaceae sp.]